MKTFRHFVVGGIVAATALMLVPTKSEAYVAYFSPTGTLVRPAYRPLFPGMWWRRQARRMAFSPVVPVTTAAMPMTAMSPVSFGGCAPCGGVTACSPCAPSCAPAMTCTQSQSCYKVCEPRTTYRYVAQTCYRTQVSNVPVTTYQSVVTRDPCTGCCTTCMRPVTAYVRQVRKVPYTAYRLVAQTVQVERTVCRPVVSCSPCVTPCSVPSCPTCPTAPAVQACPTCPASNGGAQVGQPTVQPTLKPAAPADPPLPPTPQAEVNGAANGNSNGGVRVQPMKDLDNSYRPSLEPELFDTREDKTTSLDRGDRELRHVSLLPLSRQPESRPARKLDDSGWRAAR